MAAYRLIAEDCALQISFGGPHTGEVVVWSSATSYKGLARRLSIRETNEQTNVKAAGDARKKFRFHSGDSTLEIEGFIPSTGHSFQAAGTGVSFLGYNIKIEYKPLSSLSAYHVWTGVVSEWSAEWSVAAEQIERIVVMCDADTATA